jgi:RNA polymerase sigma-70 factor, ECF subfamily
MLIDNQSDTELIRMSRTGDRMAFSTLVRRHDRAVFGLIARYVDNAEDAKDIYQEVFLRVHRGLNDFRFKSEFSTWVYRITVNICMDHAKRIKRSVFAHAERFDHTANDDSAPRFEPVSPAPGPDQGSIDADIAGRIRSALNQLPPRQRMVFILRHEEGHSMKEIASSMGCGEGTVKRYLFEATRTMRSELRDLLHTGEE